MSQDGKASIEAQTLGEQESLAARERLETAINALPKWQEVVRLYLDGMTLEQIAHTLGIKSTSTVQYRLDRGLALLSGELGLDVKATLRQKAPERCRTKPQKADASASSDHHGRPKLIDHYRGPRFHEAVATLPESERIQILKEHMRERAEVERRTYDYTLQSAFNDQQRGADTAGYKHEVKSNPPDIGKSVRAGLNPIGSRIIPADEHAARHAGLRICTARTQRLYPLEADDKAAREWLAKNPPATHTPGDWLRLFHPSRPPK